MKAITAAPTWIILRCRPDELFIHLINEDAPAFSASSLNQLKLFFWRPRTVIGRGVLLSSFLYLVVLLLLGRCFPVSGVLVNLFQGRSTKLLSHEFPFKIFKTNNCCGLMFIFFLCVVLALLSENSIQFKSQHTTCSSGSCFHSFACYLRPWTHKCTSECQGAEIENYFHSIDYQLRSDNLLIASWRPQQLKALQCGSAIITERTIEFIGQNSIHSRFSIELLLHDFLRENEFIYLISVRISKHFNSFNSTLNYFVGTWVLQVEPLPTAAK